MAIREKEQRKFRTLLKNMAINELDEVDIFSWTYCLKYGFDEDEFLTESAFMEDMYHTYTGGDVDTINKFESSVDDDDIEKYYELYECATCCSYESSRDLLSAVADKFCEEILKCEYIPSFLWIHNIGHFMDDAFTVGVINRVNVFIKLGTLFDGVNEFITMDDKPNFETRKPWNSVTLHDMNEYYAKRVAKLSPIYAQKVSEKFSKMLDEKDKKYDDLISVDFVVSRLLQCQQEGIKSCRKLLQNASEDEKLFNYFTRYSEGIDWMFRDLFCMRFHDYFLKKEK